MIHTVMQLICSFQEVNVLGTKKWEDCYRSDRRHENHMQICTSYGILLEQANKWKQP
jgi:hypothetical protein